MRILEKEQEFKEWLEQGHYEKRTIGSRIANCKTVNEKYDLYKYFKEGKTQEIYRLFTYTTDDKDSGLKPLHAIPINGNPYTGTHTYKSTIKLYFSFLGYYEIKQKETKLTDINIFKEDDYISYLDENISKVKDYINYIKNIYKLLGVELYSIVEDIYKSHNIDLLHYLKDEGAKYLLSTFKDLSSITQYTSGFRKYIDFIEQAIYNDFDTISDPDIEDETEISEKYKIEELLFIPKDSYTFEEIREKFFNRLTSQNRFNQKSDFYFPIRFIGQYFNKTGDKKYFENIINKQISNIQFFYNKDHHDIIKNLKELSISEDGRVFINGEAILSEDSKNNYVPFEVNEISEIDIDHKKSMDSILRELKGEDFGQLVKITKALNEKIKKRNNKKLAKKGTILSDDVEFRNSIDKTELKREFEYIIGKMELQLMQNTHNNYKRNKV
ncbi:hypothetical protein [uncultured Capnocytophaga sp.]|uniref:hypothetical protein n=1 Tax=uncultured Capnocytophaga sp. TaxID=159273 RepID=UPI0026251A94|nr:hypothetical protein [uncultured Capnocytophaga sp.]